MLRSSSAGQAKAPVLISMSELIRKKRIGLQWLQGGAEIPLDALQRGVVVGFKADHDHRRGVGGAGKAEAISILHPYAVDGQYTQRAREGLGGLQLLHQAV